MLRPLWVDVGLWLLPLLVAGLLFVAGLRWWRWPTGVRGIALVMAGGVVIVGGLALARRLPLEVTAYVVPLGGLTVLLGQVALFLLGVAWRVPGRSFSSSFLAILAAVAGLLVLIESSGPLSWRLAPSAWQRVPDDEGLLQQSDATTCGPTAAVMLLNRYGVASSEGEQAYLAGTTLLGTDAHGVERALRQKVAPRGWQVRVSRATYDECPRDEAFLVHVHGSTLGHALLVERWTPTAVVIADPADGRRYEMSRAAFEHLWDGTMIRLVSSRSEE